VATNTDRIDQHQEKIAGIVEQLKHLREITNTNKDGVNGEIKEIQSSLKQVLAELSETRTAVARLDERLKVLEKHADHPAALASQDQRLKALEKGSDRTWQFAAMGISVVAMLVSLLVAFVKK
jgi:chromosome segregation ATPase